MATNRLTDIEKWDRPWFRELSPNQKLFWLYLCDRCDHLGDWYPDAKAAEFHLGFSPELPEFLEVMAKQVELTSAGRWRIKDFTEFQKREMPPSPSLSLLRVGDGLIENKGIGDVGERGKGERRVLQPRDVRPISVTDAKKRVSRSAGASTTAVDFVSSFGNVYEKRSGETFQHRKKYFELADELIKTHGVEVVVRKAEVLLELCENQSAWWTKDGWAEFTIDNLHRNWNRLLTKVPADKKLREDLEILKELKKLEDERRAKHNSHS